MKKTLAFVLAILLCSAVVFAAPFSAVNETAHLEQYYLTNRTTVTSFEECLALASIGYKIGGSKFTLDMAQSGLDAAKIDSTDGSEITMCAKYILFALASGKTPSEFAGKDVVTILASKQDNDGSFGADIYKHYIAVLALDAAKADYNKEKAAHWLVSQQFPDGGWGWDTVNLTSDVDTTAMMLWTLSGHREVGGVNAAIVKALDFTKSQQQADGSFSSWGAESPSTAAYVIIALVDLGEDVFSPQYKGIADTLLAFKNTDGSYRLSKTGDETFDGFTTTQVFLAYTSLLNEKSAYKTLFENGGFEFSKEVSHLSFSSASVSSYAVSSAAADTFSAANTANPATGDQFNVILIFLIISAAVLTFLLIIKRKK